jgi:nucleoside-triphosphatase
MSRSTNRKQPLPRIFIISGEINSGKSTFLGGVVIALQLQRTVVGGFIADKHFRGNGDFSYVIRDVQTGRSMPLASKESTEGWVKTGNFYFNPQAVAFGNELLAPSQHKDSSLIIIDEIGPFELEGKMWADGVSRLMTTTRLPMIWVVRSGLVDQVISKWNISKPVIMDIKVLSVPLAVKQILSKLAVSH